MWQNSVGPVTKTTWALGVGGSAAGLWLMTADNHDEFDSDHDDSGNVVFGLLVIAGSLAAAAVMTPLAMTSDRSLLEADVVSSETCDKISTSEWKAMVGTVGDDLSDNASQVKEAAHLDGKGYRDSDYEPYIPPGGDLSTGQGSPYFDSSAQSPMDGL